MARGPQFDVRLQSNVRSFVPFGVGGDVVSDCVFVAINA